VRFHGRASASPEARAVRAGLVKYGTREVIGRVSHLHALGVSNRAVNAEIMAEIAATGRAGGSALRQKAEGELGVFQIQQFFDICALIFTTGHQLIGNAAQANLYLLRINFLALNIQQALVLAYDKLFIGEILVAANNQRKNGKGDT